jgi:hypothetical protein
MSYIGQATILPQGMVMKHKLSILIDLPEDNDIHHFIKQVERVGDVLNVNRLDIEIVHTYSKIEENTASFMQAVVSGLLSIEKYTQARREYYCYDEKERDVSIYNDEMFIYIREDHEKIIVSAGDWAVIAEDEFWDAFQTLIKQHIYLINEDIPPKLKEIELAHEYSPPLVREDADGYVDVDDEGKHYIFIGHVSEEWLKA